MVMRGKLYLGIGETHVGSIGSQDLSGSSSRLHQLGGRTAGDYGVLVGVSLGSHEWYLAILYQIHCSLADSRP